MYLALASDGYYTFTGNDTSVLGIKVRGLKTSGARTTGLTTVTDTYNILSTDETVVCNKTTAFTVTLPTAVVGQKFTIKNINTGAVTVQGQGTDTIDEETNQLIYEFDSMQVQCYSANKWGII
jgi:hypothetical protein